MFNFFRFGEDNNCVVFDTLPKYINEPIDKVYESIRKDPQAYIKEVKSHGIINLMGISGVIGSDYDFSNGTGKSTILEAICYGLYDQVVRRTANTDKIEKACMAVVTRFNGVLPSELKEMYVEIIFEESGKVYRLKRGRAIRSLTSHSPVLEFQDVTEGEDSQSGHRTANTNESIAKVLNLDYEVFVNSVMFGQSDAGAFLTGNDKKRKEMLINILHLENIVSGCLEKVRDRKNAKQKDIDNLNAKMQLVSERLKSIGSVDDLKVKIGTITASIKKCEKESEECRKQMEVLMNSESVKELESIKTEGSKVKAELLEKKKQKEDQIKEWVGLSENCVRSIDKNSKETSSAVDKKSEVEVKIKSNKKKISEFKLEDKKKELAIVERAKKAKPEYTKKISELEENSSEINKNVASCNTRINMLRDEISSLEGQIENSNGKEDFVCDKCKSVVTRKHIESELLKNKDSEKQLTESKTKYSQEYATAIASVKESKDKLEKINGWLIKEGKIKADIQEFENCKARESELDSSLKEIDDLIAKCKSEQKELSEKKSQYEKKSSEVGSKYDGEIKELNDKLNELAGKYKKMEESTKAVGVRMEELRKNISAVSEKKSQFNSQIGSIRKEIENVESETKNLEDIKVQLSNENTLFNRLIVLEDCFGLEGIQTRIVSKYLPLLNVYIKEFMDILSNGAMAVKLYVNSKSKVDILITGGTSDNFIMLSGGEKMLVRMAVDVGLALLSFSRCSQKPEVICLDEVFGPLDNSHIEAVFRLLKRLQDKFNRVLVISHKAEINDLIPHQILVEKDEGAFGRSRIKKIV